MTSAPQYLVLGDDLTGSLEAAALYARSGTACVVSVSKGLPDGVSAEAVVVDTETRHVDPERASASITKTIVDARACGISKIYLKVDSTLRGSIPAQLRGALAGWPGRSDRFYACISAYGAHGSCRPALRERPVANGNGFRARPNRSRSDEQHLREALSGRVRLRYTDYGRARITRRTLVSRTFDPCLAMQNQRSSCAISHSSLSMLDGLVFAPDLRGCWPS